MKKTRGPWMSKIKIESTVEMNKNFWGWTRELFVSKLRRAATSERPAMREILKQINSRTISPGVSEAVRDMIMLRAGFDEKCSGGKWFSSTGYQIEKREAGK